MLNKGQIKFSKAAATVAKSIFEKKKASEFLQVSNQKDMSVGVQDLYEVILGVKQDMSNQMIYALDSTKAKSLFEKTLLKDGRLSRIVYSKRSCVLYITNSQQSEFDSIKTPDSKWPDVLLEEKDNCIVKFESAMKTNFVNLPDLISSCSKVQKGEPSVIKKGSMDDSVLYERRKMEIRKELESSLSKIKDDLATLESQQKEFRKLVPKEMIGKLDSLESSAKRLQSVDIFNLDSSGISKHVDELKKAFNSAGSMLKSGSQAAKSLKTLVGSLDILKNVKNPTDELAPADSKKLKDAVLGLFSSVNVE